MTRLIVYHGEVKVHVPDGEPPPKPDSLARALAAVLHGEYEVKVSGGVDLTALAAEKAAERGATDGAD